MNDDNHNNKDNTRQAAVRARAAVFLLLCALGGSLHEAAARPGRGASEQQQFSGVVTKVSDGDTLWVRPAQCAEGSRCKPVKVRMQGIDAPESCQAWGDQAARALRERLLNRTVEVTGSAHDVYGRTLGDVQLGDEDVGAWMVSQGHAWSYRHGHSLGPYVREETQARQAHRGLFADANPTEPRVFRKTHGPCERER